MSLDPKTNRETREATKAAGDEPPPLEPDFPYIQLRFDAAFFQADVVLTLPKQGADE